MSETATPSLWKTLTLRKEVFGFRAITRPNRVFTAYRRIVLYKVGRLKPKVMEGVTEAIVAILRR